MAGAHVEAELARLLGSDVAEAVPTSWGFRARTDIVTFADGEQGVVQRFTDAAAAAQRMRAAQALEQPASEVGIRLARVLRADLDAQPAWIVFERLPGEPLTALEGGLQSPQFEALAEAMGDMLRRWRALPTAAADSDGAWADPERLAAAATGWLDVYGWSPPERQLVLQTIAAVPGLFADRSPVLAHGDFAPLNVLTDGRELTALIDLEFVRVADRLFDVAWWMWTVSMAPAHVLETAAPCFLRAAEVDPDEALFRERVDALQVLHMLELLATGDLEPGIARAVAGQLQARAARA